LCGADVPEFMNVLMNVHIGRYLRHYPPASPGHIYQSRYTNSIVEPGAAILRVAKYVEANALTAGVVKRAEDYAWSSASPLVVTEDRPLLSEWPVPKPDNWSTLLNLRTSAQELKRIQRGIARGAPYGSSEWVARVAKQYELEHPLRRCGRPTRAESGLPVDDRFLRE
jgi:putative transposase